MTRDEFLRRSMDEMQARLRDLFDLVVDADNGSPQLLIFEQALATLDGQRARLDLADDSQVKYWFTSATLLGEQMEAEAAFRSVSWRTGFFEALGRRYVEMLDGLPTAKEALQTAADLGRSTASGLGALAVIAVVAALIYVYAQERGRA
jgi:hypothetical protein